MDLDVFGLKVISEIFALSYIRNQIIYYLKFLFSLVNVLMYFNLGDILAAFDELACRSCVAVLTFS